MSFSSNSLSESEKGKIKRYVDEYVQIQQECDDLKGGIKDAGKVLAEELGIKPAELNKACRSAYKQTLAEEKEKLDVVEELLVAAGRA